MNGFKNGLEFSKMYTKQKEGYEKCYEKKIIVQKLPAYRYRYRYFKQFLHRTKILLNHLSAARHLPRPDFSEQWQPACA
jgi:hypothetical protein